jgi:NitT/TauT family transport system substrate-binding protein
MLSKTLCRLTAVGPLKFGRALPALTVLTIATGLMAAGSSQAQTRPLRKVTIAVGSQVVNASYPWLTLPIALGYWRDAGYDVQVIGVSGSTQGIQQVAAGDIEFAEANSTGLVQANTESNVPLRGIMGNGVIDWGLAVKDGSPIRSIKDLKGKRIGIVSFATGGMVLLKSMLRNNGMTDADVQIIAVGAGGPALDSLNNDRVQALMFWQSALTGFENVGTKLRVFHDPLWSSMPDFTLVALQKTIDKDPAMVEAIVRGSAEATLFAWTNPDCARKIHWAHFPSTKPTGADPDTLARWDLNLVNAQLDTLHGAYQLNGGKLIGAMDINAYSRFQDFMFDEKLITKKVPPAQLLIDKPGFIEAVNNFDHQAVIDAAKTCKGS